jgi:hypothetical protein
VLTPEPLGDQIARSCASAVATVQHPPLRAVELADITASEDTGVGDRVLSERGHLIHQAEHLRRRVRGVVLDLSFDGNANVDP